jgi:carboxylesterase type B
VCLFGESAGAIMIHDLLLSEKSYLFNRAVFQSASGYMDTAFREPANALHVSLSFAEKVGCLEHPLEDASDTELRLKFPKQSEVLHIKYFRQRDIFNKLTADVYKCLLKQNASLLSQKQFELDYVNNFLPMNFVPTSDYNQLLTGNPADVHFPKNRNFNHDLLIGINENEGNYFTYYAYFDKYFNLTHFFKNDIKYDNKFVEERVTEMLRTKVPNDVNENDELHQYYFKRFASCLSDVYSVTGASVTNCGEKKPPPTCSYDLDTDYNKDKNSPELAWQKLSKIMGDVTFSCPSILIANKYSEINPKSTYFYKFSKRAKSNPWPKWMVNTFETKFILKLKNIKFIFQFQGYNAWL